MSGSICPVGNNQADTVPHGIIAEALKKSGWVKIPFLKTKDWRFKPDSEVLTSIRLKGPSNDLIEGIEKTANFICTSKTTDPVFVWKNFNSFPKLQKIAAFKLRLSPHCRQNCNASSITKPSELELANQKLVVLAQSELFNVEVNALHKNSPL